MTTTRKDSKVLIEHLDKYLSRDRYVNDKRVEDIKKYVAHAFEFVQQKELAKDMAQELSDFLNTFSSEMFIEDLIKAMHMQHRTLQQEFTKMCFTWIQSLASQEHFDLRNEASVEACKLICERVNFSEIFLPCV